MAAKKFGFKNKRKKIISDINITPFVDVLLVLLIIFMISAPMMTSSININLPEGTNNNSKENNPISITIDKAGKIFIDDKNIKLSQIKDQLLIFSNNNLNNVIFIRADIKIDYGRVMAIVKRINDSGFKNVSFATKIKQ